MSGSGGIMIVGCRRTGEPPTLGDHPLETSEWRRSAVLMQPDYGVAISYDSHVVVTRIAPEQGRPDLRINVGR